MAYVEHDEVKNRKWFDTEKFLDIHQVKFTGFRCPKPLFKFEHANFPEFIMDVIKSQESSYQRPTAMQCLCWPILLSGRDLIAVSNSGYGKHLSYLLPGIVHVKSKLESDAKGPSVLILTPYQPVKDDILAIAQPFLDAANLKCISLYENEEKSDQVEKLKTAEPFEFLIANPMRLLDIISESQTNEPEASEEPQAEREEKKLIDLSNVTYLIVDEYIQFRKTQTMDNVKSVTDMLRSDRQTAVFSRLVPSGIQRQGDEFVKNCIFFEMHHDKESADDEIKQIVELCDKHLKSSRLVELVDRLTTEKDAKILIYAKDKEKCLNLNYELKRHLDMDVMDFRKEDAFVTTPNCILSTFKNIGLEITIPDLHYIINVDFPPNLQTYADRLRKGVVHYTFFTREDAKHAERLIYSLKQSRQEFDPNLVVISKAWLECGRDVRFMPMMQDIQKGISKPLQEMILSSGDEDTISNGGFGNTSKDSGFGGTSRFGGTPGRRIDSQTDDMADEDEEDEDEDESEDDDFGN